MNFKKVLMLVLVPLCSQGAVWGASDAIRVQWPNGETLSVSKDRLYQIFTGVNNDGFTYSRDLYSFALLPVFGELSGQRSVVTKYSYAGEGHPYNAEAALENPSVLHKFGAYEQEVWPLYDGEELITYVPKSECAVTALAPDRSVHRLTRVSDGSNFVFQNDRLVLDRAPAAPAPAENQLLREFTRRGFDEGLNSAPQVPLLQGGNPVLDSNGIGVRGLSRLAKPPLSRKTRIALAAGGTLAVAAVAVPLICLAVKKMKAKKRLRAQRLRSK